MYSVCLTNDDGPHSQGLLKLADKLSEVVNLTVIVPENQRSATGKSLTLNRPLRVNKSTRVNGYNLITHDGTPADSVILATHFMEKIDLVVSGINAGGNIGYQSMFTSGTVGAAFEAAIKGIPAIATSMEASPADWFNPSGSNREFDAACDKIQRLAMKVLKEGLPEGIDALNLNLPCDVTEKTKIVVALPTRIRMTNEVDQRVDPHGREYYWFKGIEQCGNQGDDVQIVLDDQQIALSPIIIETVRKADLDKIRYLTEI
ncbi:MAG: 5'/3'-nucleotidase SurE [Candidatus Thorarchaeota archaeon]